MKPLANRLAVHILDDLANVPPRSISTINSWVENVGFWLADLSRHPLTPDQLPFMVGRMALVMSQGMVWPMRDCTQIVQEHLALFQRMKEMQS